MALKLETSVTFEPRRVIQPIYTGGTVDLSEDGTILATSLGEEALLSDMETGRHLARINGDGEPLTSLSLAPDASYLITCSRSLSMRTYALELSGDRIDHKLLRSLKPHTTPVVTSVIDATSSLLATGGADGVVKVWDIRGGYSTHTLHGHSGVISALRFFVARPRSNRRPAQSGEQVGEEEITALFRLASGAEDGKIRIWDLHKKKSVALIDAHASIVRSLDYSSDRNMLLSGSRDKTVMMWDAQTWQNHATIPVLEEVESVGFLARSATFFTAGERGVVRLWRDGLELTEEQPSGAETDAILQVLHFPNLPFLLSVHADQALRLHAVVIPDSGATAGTVASLNVYRRISGTHDEVIDLAYIGTEGNMLALATNLEDIRIISIEESQYADNKSGPTTTRPYFGADVALLKGHSDVIITLDTDWSGHWLTTGAKDNTAKLWRLDPSKGSYVCYATFTGHAESIGAVALPNAIPQIGSKEYISPLDFPPKFLVSGSQDKTVKRWDIPAAGSNRIPKAAYTRKAHDKDINAIEVSYSASTPLFASASQDRTVKIWDVGTGEAIGVLRGHKRGVWSVAFSPPSMPTLSTNEAGGASTAKGMVVTGSGDKSVRIWSLSDYSCLRTFEGHANSVLKVVWLPVPEGSRRNFKNSSAVRVASAAGDGLVKIWDAQQGECAATLDNHIDRVWALAVRPVPARQSEASTQHRDSEDASMQDVQDEDAFQETSLEIVSGSADSTLTFWQDTTATTALNASTRATARIEQDQELQNYIRERNYREAIVLALQLNHPKRLLDLFTAVVTGPQEANSLSGAVEVDNVLASLSDGELWNLLKRLRDWNANARTHPIAQRVLYVILHLYPKDRLLRLGRRRKNSTAPAALDSELHDFGDDHNRSQSKESTKDILDALRAYTERHYSRLEKTADERFVLLWTLQQMDEVSGDHVAELSMNGMMNGHEESFGEDQIMLED